MNLNPMFSKRLALVLLLTTSLISSCAVIDKIIPDPVPTNALSGREGTNGPLLVVKIDDTNSARPQIGLEDADVVYIEQVEGGLTRLAAVFSSRIPIRVGPVRSARISDIEIMSQYGRVAFAYSGAQKKLLPVISTANVQDLGAQRQSPTIYTTDPSRNQPYAMVLRADLLMQKIIDSSYVVDSAKTIGFIFGEKPIGGIATETVEVNWPAARYQGQWSSQENRWLLSHNGSINVADSGIVLGPTTFIIQMVSITPSEYGDKFGGVTPFSQTIGTGKAYVLRDGERFETTWNRAFADSGTTFTMADGSQLNFAAGQIWVALTDREPIFTSPISDESK
jgi:hypothetical protein